MNLLILGVKMPQVSGIAARRRKYARMAWPGLNIIQKEISLITGMIKQICSVNQNKELASWAHASSLVY